MSKLTETLKKQIPGNLNKNVSIKFEPDFLDNKLLDGLGIYLATKSPTKLIELSFTSVAIKNLNDQDSILDQIQYKPAKQLLEILSQQPRDNIDREIQSASVPRWMVLVIGSRIHLMNGKDPVTVEDAINMVFHLCISYLEKSLGSYG